MYSRIQRSCSRHTQHLPLLPRGRFPRGQRALARVLSTARRFVHGELDDSRDHGGSDAVDTPPKKSLSDAAWIEVVFLPISKLGTWWNLVEERQCRGEIAAKGSKYHQDWYHFLLEE